MRGEEGRDCVMCGRRREGVMCENIGGRILSEKILKK